MVAKIFLASSNAGKLREFQALARGCSLDLKLELLPRFDSIPEFEESAPTYAENSLGKALYYSAYTNEAVLADDSGLVVPGLGGRPGVHSARYAGTGATSEQRIDKLLQEMNGMAGAGRAAHFVCALSLVKQNRGAGGFGYDPIFFFPTLQKSFAELTAEEKNQQSHRGKAFRRLLAVLADVL